ncbi:MAG: putative ABC transporter permease, partial [Gallintestinimicrobium sp.]
HEKRFVNRGFIRGPFLPLYGTGALMMLIVSMPFQDNLILTYVAGCVGATVLEYITGVLMETLFKVRYWDYSHKKFNFQGQICLESSLAWGFLTILMTRMIQKPIEAFALWLPSSVLTDDDGCDCDFAADFALSFKAA